MAGKADKPAATEKTASKKAAPAKATAKPAAPAEKPAPSAVSSAEKKPAKAPMDKPAAKTAAKTASKPKAASSASGDKLIYGHAPYQVAGGEEYMNTQQLGHFRNILLGWKKELMEEVDRTVHHMQDESANLPDPNDRATQEEEFSLELRARDRERKLIKKIDQTLGKIDEDDYGYCESCGVEIGIRRLEARPTATMCIDCKEIAEIKEKQLGG